MRTTLLRTGLVIAIVLVVVAITQLADGVTEIGSHWWSALPLLAAIGLAAALLMGRRRES